MGKVKVPMYTVDAFTATPFSGNPAAVCLIQDSESVTDKQKQQIAAEMNITTAFLEFRKAGDSFDKVNHFNLRWFTPKTEITLCGHATLATAAVLMEVIGNPHKDFIFQTKEKGEVRTRMQDGLVVLNLPQSTTREVDKSSVESLLKLLCPTDLVEEVRYSPEVNDLLVRLKPKLSRKEFEELGPNIKDLVQHGKYRAVCITTQALDSRDDQGKPYDYLKRVFAPWIGIMEDPVTGSSFTMTAPYWQGLLGKSKIYARQCSARGGDVSIQVLDEGRLEVAGAATINLQGTFTISLD